MALVKCKGCGEVISNKAKTCPKCGEPRSSIGCLGYILGVFVGLVVLAFVMRAGDPPVNNSENNRISLSYSGKSAVRNVLKDGDSAKFRNYSTETNRNGVSVLCGEVNAKNGFGAYTGFKRFIAGNGLASIDDNSEGFNQLWSRMCN